MKLVLFSENMGKKRVGVLAEGERILDVAAVWEDYFRATGMIRATAPETVIRLLEMGEEGLKTIRNILDLALRDADHPEHFAPLEKVILHAPLGRPPKIICIGMNYLDHCRELGQEAPASPIVFAKFGTAILDPDKPIVRPRITKQLDYEAELGVVIGKGGRNIGQEKALEHVAGYLNFNDVSARDLQFSDGQWVRGKTCDTFAPMGPWLVTRDEVENVQNLSIICRVNGKVMQESNTRQMVFTADYLVSFLSQFMTLEAGDVIATGTPPGVGTFRKPPVYLQPGDLVEVEIEGLGVLRNGVEAE